MNNATVETIWTGFNDIAHEGVFVWSDGTPVSILFLPSLNVDTYGSIIKEAKTE